MVQDNRRSADSIYASQFKPQRFDRSEPRVPRITFNREQGMHPTLTNDHALGVDDLSCFTGTLVRFQGRRQYGA